VWKIFLHTSGIIKCNAMKIYSGMTKPFSLIALFVILLIQTQIGLNQSIHTGEKVYIFTDRNLYVAGDQLYFKFHKIANNESEQKSIFGYIILRSANNVIVKKIPLRLKNDVAYGSIYLPDTIQTGIYQIIGFTNRMRNFPGVSSNSKEILIANRFDSELNFLLTSYPLNSQSDIVGDSLIVDQNVKPVEIPFSPIQIFTSDTIFSQRSKIEVELRLNDTINSYEISISVAQKNSINGFEYSLIDFGSANTIQEIKPNFTFNNYSFLPETRQIIISGKVIDTNTNQGVENQFVLLSKPDTVINLQYSKTDNNPYYYSSEAIVSLLPEKNKPEFKIQLFDKYEFTEPFRAIEMKVVPELRNFITESQNILKVQKAFDIDYNYTLNVETEKGFTPVLYSAPYSKLILKDYFSLKDFREISRELISPLRIRQNKNEIVFNLVNNSNRNVFEKSPAIFLNGIVMYDLEKILPLGSDELEKIEIHNLPWVFGDLEFPGIIGVFTKSTDDSKLLSGRHTSFYVEEPISPSGYIDSEKVIPPQSLKPNEPDFRQLLYWNPSLHLSQKQKTASLVFYSGDIRDDFIIKIEAISSQGEKIFETKMLKVN
jgi:hypothetical protein